MTVQSLIEQLQRMPQDADVRIKQPAHDHWRTMTTAEICSVNTEILEWSDYHSTFVTSQDAVHLDDTRPTKESLRAVVLG